MQWPISDELIAIPKPDPEAAPPASPGPPLRTGTQGSSYATARVQGLYVTKLGLSRTRRIW